jgi:hypothetical protein
MIVSLLFPLALIALIVWLIMHSKQRGLAPEKGLHTFRRFLQYTFLLAALFTAGAGLSRLVIAALPTGAIADRRAVDVALGLSLTFVAVPAWVLLGRMVYRRLMVDVDERASAGWALYLVAAVSVSLLIGYLQLIEVGRWLIGLQPYAPDQVGYALVWTALWVSHTWLLAHPRLRPTARLVPLAPLTGSAAGLVGVAVGGGGVLAAGLRELYRIAAGPAMVESSLRTTLGTSVIVATLGAVVWWWHWWRQALAARRDGLWNGYVLLVGVLGGLAATVGAAAGALHALLQWWFGVPEASTAAAHFDLLPGTLAATITGLWVWRYHRGVLDTGTATTRTEPERVYTYLVSAVGLIAAAGGATVAIMAAIQALTPGALATVDPRGRNSLAIAATLLIVGAPLWVSFWLRIPRDTLTLGQVELRSPTRRSYLVLLFGAGALTTATSLAVILFVVIRDLLEQQLTVTVFHDLRAAIGLIVTAAAVGTYHGIVYRNDRRMSAPEQISHPRDVLLISPDGRALVTALAAGTGAHVHSLHRLDIEAHTIDADRVAAAILASPYERVVVTIEEDDQIRVIPYDRS